MPLLPEAIILGIAQDGGVPQPACTCNTCMQYVEGGRQLSPTSIAVRDGDDLHLFDVTRDLARQLLFIPEESRQVTDVWLTHGHLGHVDGLGLFGKEAMGAKGIRLHVSESMLKLIQNTPRWDSMLKQGVFQPNPFVSNETMRISSNLSIKPISVPHRDEFTDTHAFLIRGPERVLLHLPDHDRWETTLTHVGTSSIREWFRQLEVDIALIDGTFWSEDEIPRQSNVPHPPISETISLLGPRKPHDVDLRFIHFNHTNPVLCKKGQSHDLDLKGWTLASEGEVIDLSMATTQ
ncbi:MAG: MBL fold metallo-hydrolase [Candidatus Thermoplasmatota archaeon]|nr:MBL fold metallo-hydrolase [Candidatus Thermoplasmatota archaeon]